MASITSSISSLLGGITSIFQGLIESILAVFSHAFSLVTGIFATAWSAVEGVISAALHTVQGLLSTVTHVFGDLIGIVTGEQSDHVGWATSLLQRMDAWMDCWREEIADKVPHLIPSLALFAPVANIVPFALIGFGIVATMMFTGSKTGAGTVKSSTKSVGGRKKKA